MKPLFIPLFTRYFEQFERGEKHMEYRRPGGPFNPGTCYPGRLVTLSCGYGAHRRLQGKITFAENRDVHELNSADRRDIQALFGPLCKTVFCIGIEIITKEPAS